MTIILTDPKIKTLVFFNMTINENLSSFNHRKIVDFKGKISFLKFIYRISINKDNEEGGFDALFQKYCDNPITTQTKELVIGAWFNTISYKNDSTKLVDLLIQNKDKLPKLEYLFLGDITYQECEMSWINQCDVSPLLAAYPQLKHFQVRGGNGLSFGSLHHTSLETLIVETGGMDRQTLIEIANATLPNLKHLELWLGNKNYGWTGTLEDLQPFLSGDHFPKLTYLGLKNSEISDEIARALNNASILDGLEVLDLSMGTLGDKGAQALLANPKITQLKSLILRHHYISEELSAKLSKLPCQVDLSDPVGNPVGDEDDRYVEVGE
ncbi:STM4015 family protein [Rapidithrix thailandica]|uniref:STM4015 family protein n=1 Tax=Rapidithrix thailandica TaxID=413964 RepID=A0AAW9S3N6_9BACT